MDKLARQVAHAKETSHYYFQSLAGFNPFHCVTREALAKLPLTRKRDLIALQKKHPPFGGLNSLPGSKARRVFASPGPIYELQGNQPDHWRMARVLYAAGFRHGDLVHNCYSYHFTPGAFMMEGGARKLGCSVFPRRGRADRATGPGDSRFATGRLCRHTILSAHHCRKGRGAWRRHQFAEQGLRFPARPCRASPASGCGRAASWCASVMRRLIQARLPTSRKPRRA